MPDKYTSYKQKTNGYTFANIGLFYGLGTTMFSTVYSLILLDIFKNPAIVGLYSSAFACIAVLFSLFSAEIFRLVPKTKIFPISIVAIIMASFGMVFQPSAGSFIALDVMRECSWAIFAMTLSLFMSEFSGVKGISEVNGRYYTLNNLGSIIAPIIALRTAVVFDNDRAPLILVCITMFICLMYYRNYKITAADKRARPKAAKDTFKKVLGNALGYLKNKNLVRAYFVNFGYYAIHSLRGLYVPIAVISAGFSKDTLGIMLALGTVPFVLMAVPISRVAKKRGANKLLMLGFGAYAVIAMIASTASGWLLLGLFVLWQIPNAMSEPIKDLPFYQSTNKTEQGKFIGIFKTAKYTAYMIAPLAAAAVISVAGTVNSVWVLAAVVGISASLISRNIK